MNTNQTKAKLQAGETVLGCFLRYPVASLVEVMGLQGWDFLVFDGEHGTLMPGECENMVRAAELSRVTPLVRVTTNQPSILLRFLDTGAQGAHVPWVNSAAEAEGAVRSIKYHPRGQRGLAGVRASDYGQRMPLAEYVTRANAETLTVIQIETAEAVNHLSEILAVPDIDVIFVGPTDLSQSYGFPGQPQQPQVQEAIQQVLTATLQAGRVFGTMVNDVKSARQWQERGARYLTTTFEAIACPPMREYLSAVRQ